VSAARTWGVELTQDDARALGAKIPEGSTLPVVLTVEVDEAEVRTLYRAALTNKGGRAKSGALSVRRGRA
jgi:hypothetical protein